ncbi:MAG: hypothetical protein JWN72_2482 [Thermoleophilia bacterium]|nr:hypothetical protein [Thermoleophilia bacterium]
MTVPRAEDIESDDVQPEDESESQLASNILRLFTAAGRFAFVFGFVAQVYASFPDPIGCICIFDVMASIAGTVFALFGLVLMAVAALARRRRAVVELLVALTAEAWILLVLFT